MGVAEHDLNPCARDSEVLLCSRKPGAEVASAWEEGGRRSSGCVGDWCVWYSGQGNTQNSNQCVEPSNRPAVVASAWARL